MKSTGILVAGSYLFLKLFASARIAVRHKKKLQSLEKFQQIDLSQQLLKDIPSQQSIFLKGVCLKTKDYNQRKKIIYSDIFDQNRSNLPQMKQDVEQITFTIIDNQNNEISAKLQKVLTCYKLTQLEKQDIDLNKKFSSINRLFFKILGNEPNYYECGIISKNIYQFLGEIDPKTQNFIVYGIVGSSKSEFLQAQKDIIYKSQKIQYLYFFGTVVLMYLYFHLSFKHQNQAFSRRLEKQQKRIENFVDKQEQMNDQQKEDQYD